MADKTIMDLSALTSVDRAADYFEIADVSDSNASKRTTVNSMLNITSQPLELTGAQSPTNKTFDNTNIFTIRDDRFTLQDNSDTTKQAVFQLSGISTGTTRTYTLPNASSTLVDLTSSQTLTGKTLTSPTISTATITNPTLTVDTVSEFTATNGVTVDGLNIKDSKLNTNDSVVTANITDSAVTGAKIANYRVLRQNDTTNTTETTARILTGWGVITNNTGAAFISDTVTFVTAFANIPIITVSLAGDNNVNGGYGTGSNTVEGRLNIKSATQTASNFIVHIHTSAGTNFAAGFSYYTWTAIGV